MLLLLNHLTKQANSTLNTHKKYNPSTNHTHARTTHARTHHARTHARTHTTTTTTTNNNNNSAIVLPDVIVPTEDHAGLCKTRLADLAQLCLAAGALETARVPVAVQRVQQEPVLNPSPASCACANCGSVSIPHWRRRASWGRCESRAHVCVREGGGRQITCKHKKSVSK